MKMDFLRNRDHSFWRWYERFTALVGLVAIPVMCLAFWNNVAGSLGARTFFQEYSSLLWSYLAVALGWILKADFFKYRMTKDPRDEPRRKWWSFKYANKFKPGERIFVRDKGFKIGPGDLIVKCPSCGHVHGFPSSQQGLVHECGVYGCKGTIYLASTNT